MRPLEAKDRIGYLPEERSIYRKMRVSGFLMPFGGVKQSGAGLPENSRTGLEFFVDRKAVYLRP